MDSVDETKNTPEKALPENYENEPDETLGERLWGLTEMFPDPIRNFTSCVTNGTISGTKNLYQLSRTLLWVVFSSTAILFVPILVESQRIEMEEIQRQQQKQMLLGPAPMHGGVPMMPPMAN